MDDEGSSSVAACTTHGWVNDRALVMRGYRREWNTRSIFDSRKPLRSNASGAECAGTGAGRGQVSRKMESR